MGHGTTDWSMTRVSPSLSISKCFNLRVGNLKNIGWNTLCCTNMSIRHYGAATRPAFQIGDSYEKGISEQPPDHEMHFSQGLRCVRHPSKLQVQTASQQVTRKGGNLCQAGTSREILMSVIASISPLR